MEANRPRRRGWRALLASLLLWALVLAGCTGLSVLVVEWVREHIPIYPP